MGERGRERVCVSSSVWVNASVYVGGHLAGLPLVAVVGVQVVLWAQWGEEGERFEVRTISIQAA